jgi:LCP family protein required for cell wall assembly
LPSRRRRRALPAIIVAGVLALLAVVGAGGVAFLIHRYDTAVHRGNLLDEKARAGDSGGVFGVHGPLNYLLLGSDQRPGDNADGERSDTIIIAHVTADLNKVYFVSIPRDLMVNIPAYPATHFNGSTDKINAAFNDGGGGQGGFQLLSRTLTSITGVKFDGAAIIDFTGFQHVISLLGGVNMCLDEPTTSIHTGAVYKPGCQHLAPWQALDYVRQREDLPGGDFDRQRHQQQLLKAMLVQAKSQGLTGNPVKSDQLIRAVGSSLTLDTNGASVAGLVYSLRGIGAGDLVGVRLPSYAADIDGTSWVLPDQAVGGLYRAISKDQMASWLAANPTWHNAI